MVKATLYIEPLFNLNQVELLKKLSSDPIDESVVQVTGEFPQRIKFYQDRGYWLNPVGRYTLILPESFFKPSNRRFFNKAFKIYKEVLKPILHLQVRVNEEMKKVYNPETDGIRPLTYFSINAEVSKKLLFAFLITDPLSEENFERQLNAAKFFIQDYLSNRNNFNKQIRRLHKVDKKTTFLLWNESLIKWELVNLLFLVGHEKMLKYKQGRDPRFDKPFMVVNEANLNREFTLPSNWSIEGQARRYTMNKPNDIAVYRSIANKTLAKARQKFDIIHSKHIPHLILPDELVSEFFDFFEEIIQAIIMSYTTIECMANSCIPFYHKHTVTEKGVTTIYNKQSIELQFKLREKLKTVIPPILNMHSPASEPWWQIFIQLETLRNEIIHSKESKAEGRYSMLVNDRIFEIASVHNLIVSHYAKSACEAKSEMMNEFPIGVGCDEIIPGLMKEKDFTKSFKSLRGIR